MDRSFSLGRFFLDSEKTMSKPCEYAHIEVGLNIFVSCPGTEDAYAEAPDGAPLDDLDDLGSEESVYETTTENNPGAWGTVVDSKPDEEGEDGMASMLGAMMARDDDAETVGSEESVYEHTTESNPGMWGTVVDSKPDEEGDDGMASMLAGMMATGDEGKP